MRQPRRWTGIGLRFVAIGHRRIEDMGAEARFRDMAGVTVLVAKQRVQPAVSLAAIAKVIDQLGMTRPRTRSRRYPAPGHDREEGSLGPAPPPCARIHRTHPGESAAWSATSTSGSAAQLEIARAAARGRAASSPGRAPWADRERRVPPENGTLDVPWAMCTRSSCVTS